MSGDLFGRIAALRSQIDAAARACGREAEEITLCAATKVQEEGTIRAAIAAGVKTVTVAVLFASALNTIRNRDEITLFNRRIEKDALRKAVAVVSMSFLIAFVSTVALSVTCDAGLVDLLYETVSATATVGLSRDLTPTLNLWGKLIVTATMYLGRVGPISLAFAFHIKSKNTNIITNPTESVSVG